MLCLLLEWEYCQNCASLQLVDVLDDGTLSVMDDDGNTRDDLNLPPGDLGKDIKDRFEKGETFTVSDSFLCYPSIP